MRRRLWAVAAAAAGLPLAAAALVPPERSRPQQPSPQYPLVLCHGLLGFDHLASVAGRPLLPYFRDIPEALAADGACVVVVRVAPTASIAERATQLAVALRLAPLHYAGAEVAPRVTVYGELPGGAASIDEYTGKFNLIGHSMVRESGGAGSVVH